MPKYETVQLCVAYVCVCVCPLISVLCKVHCLLKCELEMSRLRVESVWRRAVRHKLFRLSLDLNTSFLFFITHLYFVHLHHRKHTHTHSVTGALRGTRHRQTRYDAGRTLWGGESKKLIFPVAFSHLCPSYTAISIKCSPWRTHNNKQLLVNALCQHVPFALLPLLNSQPTNTAAAPNRT